MDKHEIAEGETQPSIDSLLAEMEKDSQIDEKKGYKKEEGDMDYDDKDKDGKKEKPEESKDKDMKKEEGDDYDDDKDGDKGGDKEEGKKKEADDEEEEKEEVSESVRDQAQKIFEASVDMKVSVIREQLEAEKEAEMAQFAEELESKIDDYCDFVVAEWMKENQIAAENSLRTEIAESFINDLKNVFLENHFEVPEEKADLCESLGATVTSLKQDKKDLMQELEEAQLEVLAVKKASIIESVGADLFENQKVKLETLAETISATDTKDFEEKLTSIKNVFFSESAEVKQTNLEEGNVITEDHDKPADGVMDIYANFISKRK